MGVVKFTFVKAIPKYLLFICFIFLFPFCGNSGIKQEFSISNSPQLKYHTADISFPLSNILLSEISFVSSALQNQTKQQNPGAEEEVENSSDNSDENIQNSDKLSIFGIFLNEEEISALNKRLKDYGVTHVPAKLRPAYNSIIDKSFEYPLILLFVVLVFFFIINIIIVFVILNNTIKRKNTKARFEKIYSKMYEEVIMSYMFGSIDWETLKVKLKKHHKKANREILVSVLMNFKSNFKGELEHFIPEIYTKLGLDKDSIKLAQSVYDHKKVKGIIELIHLHPEGAKEIVKKLINDPNDYVRSEAQTAYIRLNPETPFKFFHTLERPFTRWTQLSAFNLIRIHQLPVPSFGQFLNSKHFNIKNFSLRMITFFQQLESAPEVVKMVENNREQTRYLAYRAINDLRLYDSQELIKNKYEDETPKNKLEIIKALRNIGTREDFDFLENIMKTGNMSLKTEACRAMYYMSTESRERLMQMDKDSVPEIELLISHVTDPRN